MRQNGGKASVITGAFSLVSLVFILFSTVYDQIIAQNEGFFYMLIFGGILVLVFVLVNLITKLIAFSPQSMASAGYTVLELLIMVALGVFFFYRRFQFETTLPVEDSLFYRAATFIQDGTLSGSLDVVTKCLRNPSDFAYSVLLSFIFNFTGVLPKTVLYLNASIILVTAIFAAHITEAVGGRLCGLIAFAATLLIPSQAYGVYSYNSVILFTLTVFISLDIYIHIYMSQEPGPVKRVVMDILLAVAAGFMLFTDPVTIFFIIAMAIHYLVFSRESLKSFFITLSGIILTFVLLSAIKASALGVPMSEVLSYSFSRFNVTSNEETGEHYELSQIYESFREDINNQNQNITENYYFLFKKDGSSISAIESSWLQLATNLLYMFSLILSGSCVIYMFRSRNGKALPVMLMSVFMLVTAFIRAVTDSNGYYIFELLIVYACAGLSYMYDNQHPENFISTDIWSDYAEYEEEEEEELTEEDQEELMRRAMALVFIGEDDELYDEIKREEAEEREIMAQEAENAGKEPSAQRKGIRARYADPDGDEDMTGDEEYYEDENDGYYEEEGDEYYEDGADAEYFEDGDAAYYEDEAEDYEEDEYYEDDEYGEDEDFEGYGEPDDMTGEYASEDNEGYYEEDDGYE
ncbi:MAG TPA: hypothetical protein DCL38_08845, partial [Lachnospiraceae bacterium]|nr:hypothetical protein [Lachnospiraceae bacterium]